MWNWVLLRRGILLRHFVHVTVRSQEEIFSCSQLPSKGSIHPDSCPLAMPATPICLQFLRQCQNDLDLNLGSTAAFFHSLIWLCGQNVLTLLEDPEFSPRSHELAVDCNSLSYSERSAFSGAASSTSGETRSLW